MSKRAGWCLVALIIALVIGGCGASNGGGGTPTPTPTVNESTATCVFVGWEYSGTGISEATKATLQDANGLGIDGKQLIGVMDTPPIAIDGLNAPYRSSDRFFVVRDGLWYIVQLRGNKIYNSLLPGPLDITAC